MPAHRVPDIGLMDRIRRTPVSHARKLAPAAAAQAAGCARQRKPRGVRDCSAVGPRRHASAALGLLLTVISLIGLAGGGSAAATRPTQKPCSAYPQPGQIASASSAIPATLRRRYAILRRPQRKIDRINLRSIGSSLSASGLIPSGTRFMGDAAFGGRIYLIPARHQLSFRLAPARCLPSSERLLERELLPSLRKQYRHVALCRVVFMGNSGSPSCGPVPGTPDPLLYTSGTPGFGLVPDGVADVTVSYLTAPPRTLAVHDNFFVIRNPRQPAAPCGVQWLQPTGNVIKTPTGCSLIQLESGPLAEYSGYVETELHSLQTELASLQSAVDSGNVTAAQSSWLTAHLTWLQIGQDDGAYGAFGALGGEIDGTAAGHPLGTSDPKFTGFHRIEYDLWTTHNLAAAQTDTTALNSLVTQLVSKPLSDYLPATTIGFANWLLRPHEILEDAIRDTLTGDDDYGSGTGIASLTADIAAIRELLGLLAPVLNPVAPGLVGHVREELSALLSTADASRSNGQWVGVAELPAVERQQIDADAGAAAELLAPVPDLLTSTGKNGDNS
jgi:hypothetical protein